jgi:hypothetical protein
MPNRDHEIGLAACGEDVSGVMGPNTRQRVALIGHPLSLHPFARPPGALPDLCPSPEPGDNGRRATRARTPAPLC